MKKGFTLIELISTIIIIGILSLIAFPLTQYLINNSKQKAYSAIINNIEEAASNYSIYNELGYNELFKSIEVSKIQEKGYLTMDDIIDPRNNEVINGCVLYRWKIADKKYEFKYSENCNPKDFYPDITINVLNDNNKEWIKEKLRFNINGEYSEFKYCVSKGDNECIKDIEYITDTTIEEYGRDIYVCATGFFGEEVGKSTCTKAYNIDYTDPEITYNNSVATTDKIVVNATCSDEISGVNKIEYSINDGEYVSSNIFTKLKTGTYNIKVKCTDNALRYSVKEESVTLPEPINPDIVQEDQYLPLPNDYEFAQNRTIRITYYDTNIEKPQYYFQTEPLDSVENYATTSAKVVNCGKDYSKLSCNSTNYTTQTLEAGTWYKVDPNVDIVYIKFTHNGFIKAMTIDETGNKSHEGHANFTVTKVDSTKPNVSIASQNIMTDRTTITAICSDTDTTPNSGIIKYEFSKDGGNSWETKSINRHTFTGLTQGTNYNYLVRCTNGSGITNMDTTTDKTEVITNPTIEQIEQYIPNYEWAQRRVIRITYYDTNIISPKHYYSYDNKIWIEVSGTSIDLTISKNTDIYAKTVDEALNQSEVDKIKGTGYYNAINIDPIKPTTPEITGGSNDWTNSSRTISISKGSTALSGIAKYQYYISTSSTGQTGGSWIDGSSITVNTTGVWYIYFRSISNSGLISDVSSYQVAKVDTTVPNISFSEIPSTITSGDSYSIPTSATFGISGRKYAACFIQVGQVSRTVTNTNELSPGSYSISCTATSNAGLSTTSTKNITVDPKIGIIPSCPVTTTTCPNSCIFDQTENKIECWKAAIKGGTVLKIRVNESESYNFLAISYNDTNKTLRLMCVDDGCVIKYPENISDHNSFVGRFNKTLLYFGSGYNAQHQNWTNVNYKKVSYPGLCTNSPGYFVEGQECGDSLGGVGADRAFLPTKDEIMANGYTTSGDFITINTEWSKVLKISGFKSEGTYLDANPFWSSNYNAYFPYVFALNCGNNLGSCIGYANKGYDIWPVIEISATNLNSIVDGMCCENPVY